MAKSRRTFLLALLACIVSAGALQAQQRSLADYLPSNTLFYMEIPRPDQLDQLAKLQAPPISQLIAGKAIDLFDTIDEALGVAGGTTKLTLKRAGGLYAFADVGERGPVFAVVLQTDSAATAAKIIQGIDPKAKETFVLRLPDGPRVYGMQHREMIVFSVETEMLGQVMQRMAGVGPGTALSGNLFFQRAVGKMRRSSRFWVYADGRRALELLDKQAGDEQEYQAVRNALGFEGVRAAYAGFTVQEGVAKLQVNLAFDGGTFQAARLIPVAQQLDILAYVPRNAFGCAALTLNDPADFWQNVQEMARKLSTAMNQPQIMMGVQMVDGTVGLSVKDSAYQLLQGQVAAFLTETDDGVRRDGWVSVARVTDPEKFRNAFTEMQKRLLRGRTLPTETVKGITFYRAPQNKAYIAQIDDLLVVSGSKDAIVWYRDWLARRTPEDVFLRHVPNVSTASAFVNVGTLFSMLPSAERDSGKHDAFVILTLAHVRNEIKLTLTADLKEQMEMFAQPAVMGQVSIMAGMLLPALAKARGEARRTVEMNNLRQIAVASMMYAADHKDRTPPSLAALVPHYLNETAVLVSPADDDPKAIPGHPNLKTSYVYLGSVPSSVGAQVVLAYTRPDVHEQGRNMLFLDGHVEWVRQRSVQWRLRRSYELLKESGKIDEKQLKELAKFHEIK